MADHVTNFLVIRQISNFVAGLFAIPALRILGKIPLQVLNLPSVTITNPLLLLSLEKDSCGRWLPRRSNPGID